MNQLLLMEFKFKKSYCHFKLNKNLKISKKKFQTEVFDYIKKKFECPVSRKMFYNKSIHDKECKYTYCKSGWDWKHGVI